MVGFDGFDQLLRTSRMFVQIVSDASQDNAQTHNADYDQEERAGVQIKPYGHEFNLAGQPVILRRMNVTGG